MQTFGIRGISLGLMSGLLFGLGISHAAAVYQWSNIKSFSSNTVRYHNQSWVGTGAWGGTVLDRQDHGNASPGKMGARARVYWSDGTLCQAGYTSYNDTYTWHFNVDINAGCGGYVYSQGFTDTWNGNGYERVSTYRTVNVRGD